MKAPPSDTVANVVPPRGSGASGGGAPAAAASAGLDGLADQHTHEQSLVSRAPTGQFVAGQSGNPKGREPGSKNFVTRERLALEGALREYMGHPDRKAKIMTAIERLLEIASTGEDKQAVAAIKVLLDKVMSSAKQDEDGTQREQPTVTIVIENATIRPQPAALDAEFTEETPQ